MKISAILSLSASLLCLACINSRAADNSCRDYIQQKVQAQAQLDFPGKELTAVMPDIDEDGGSVETYEIPMFTPDQASNPFVTYNVQVDETCGIIHLYQVSSSNPELSASPRLSENEIANVTVLKTLRERDYPGTDSKQKPCRVSVESQDWGTVVNIAPSNITFYLMVNPQAASAKTLNESGELSVTTQYRGDDPDETPGHFMITNTLTVKKKRGEVESVRVRTYDSGIQVSQDAVCSIR